MHRYGWLLLAAALSACTVSDDQETAGGSRFGGELVDDGDVAGGDDGDDGTEEEGDTGPENTDPGGGDSGGSGSDEPTSGPQGVTLQTGCAAYGSDVYTPFKNYGPVSTGTVAAYPWRGPTSYPDSIEDFRTYSLPSQVECGSAKGARDHLDVTAGCLSAVSMGGDKRGQIQLTSVATIARSRCHTTPSTSVPSPGAIRVSSIGSTSGAGPARKETPASRRSCGT
jgi:hypothetical protein